MGAVPDDRPDTSQADLQLAAILCGDTVAIGPADEPPLFDAASRHDIVPLLSHVACGGSVSAGGVPPTQFSRAFVARLRAIAQQTAAADLAAEAELRRVLAAFDRSGIPALIIKGSHLAYTHYPRPDLRARTDTDLLIRRDQRERADRVLRKVLGYTAQAKLSGDLTATQALYTRTTAEGLALMVDLHWRLASPQVFAHVLSFHELDTGSRTVPALSPAARAPGSVHALVIACMHQVAHHRDEAEQFKWLYDIHLLASRFTPADWDAFASVIAERQVTTVCLHGLERSQFWFRTFLPPRHYEAWRTSVRTKREQTASYLDAPSQAAAVLDDLRALPAWSDRLRLMREHLFPSADYMRRVYAPASAFPLPVLYAVRAVRGARRWLRLPL
jgi:hypothetical protein